MANVWPYIQSPWITSQGYTLNDASMRKVTSPQDAHKEFSAAGFPWLKHLKIQWYVGKNFVSKL